MTDVQRGGAQRILVGVDGSPTSIEALEWAVSHAQASGATLRVVMSWEWPTSYGWGLAVPSDYDPAADARRQLDQALAPVRADHPDVEIDQAVIEGHPAPVLIDESARADLLVVGSRGHGEFVGMLLGSVSEHCVSNAHCPVVVVRNRDQV
ncbi:MAG: universal stress protein [Acidimicrobiales bacterium]